MLVIMKFRIELFMKRFFQTQYDKAISYWSETKTSILPAAQHLSCPCESQ